MMKLLLTTIISGFLFVSTSAFATDYSQTQNKVDDKLNSPKPAQANPSDKKDAVTNKQNYDKNDVNVNLNERKEKDVERRDPDQAK